MLRSSALRHSALALALALLLVSPAAAAGANQHYSGFVSFDAIGKRNERGRLVAKSVRNSVIRGETLVNCFDPAGNPVTSVSSDWLFPQPGPMRVSRRGSFSGQFTGGNSTTTITGRLRKGKASGIVEGKSGQIGVTTYCTTGMRPWTAKGR